MASRANPSPYRRYLRLTAVIVLASFALLPALNRSAAAACAAPSVDYGSVTSSITVSGAGTYRLWSRVATTGSLSTAYMLEIDGSNCYIVSGSSLPVVSSGASAFFANDGSNWTARTTGGANIDLSLTAGNHTIKMIGTSDGVMLDRLVLTQDLGCVPTGTGDNCASPPDTTGPVVAITSPASGSNISAATTVTANATDDASGVKQVVFYVDNTVIGTDAVADASHNYTASLVPANFAAGTHTLKAVATDLSNNVTTSGSVTFTIPTSGGTAPAPAPTYKTGDINQDGNVDYLDLSALAANYNRTGSAIIPARADINGDGVVNYLDLSALAGNYSK